LGKKGLTKREMLKNYFLFGSFPQKNERCPTRLTPCKGATPKESWLLQIGMVSSMRGWWGNPLAYSTQNKKDPFINRLERD